MKKLLIISSLLLMGCNEYPGGLNSHSKEVTYRCRKTGVHVLKMNGIVRSINSQGKLSMNYFCFRHRRNENYYPPRHSRVCKNQSPFGDY